MREGMREEIREATCARIHARRAKVANIFNLNPDFLVGIEIKNIRYFGSQPWPFPNSLMVGFTAEYASGTITPAPEEIEAAAWFEKSSLPPVPGELSIARRLIDWFVSQ